MAQSNAITLYSSSARQRPGGAGADWVPIEIDTGSYAWVPPDQKEALAQRVALSRGDMDLGGGSSHTAPPAGIKRNALGLTLPAGVDPAFQKNVSNAAMVAGTGLPILAKVASYIPGLDVLGLGGQGAQALAGLVGTMGGATYGASTYRDPKGNPAPAPQQAEELLSQLAMAGGTQGFGHLVLNPALEAGMKSAALNRAASIFRNTPGDIIADVRTPGARATLQERSQQLAQDALDQKAFPYGSWRGGDIEQLSKTNLKNLETASTQAVNAPGPNTPIGPSRIGIDIQDFLDAQRQAVDDAASGHGLSGMRQSAIQQGKNIRGSFLEDPLLNPTGVLNPQPGDPPVYSSPSDFQKGLRKLGGVTDFIGNTAGRLPVPDAEPLNLARQATYNAGSDALEQAVPALGPINKQFQRTIPVADAMRQVAGNLQRQHSLSFSEAMGMMSPAIFGAGVLADNLAPGTTHGYGTPGGALLAGGLGLAQFLRRPGVSGNAARALYDASQGLSTSPFARQMVTQGAGIGAQEANSAAGQPMEHDVAQAAQPFDALSNSRMLASWLAAQQQLGNKGGGQ